MATNPGTAMKLIITEDPAPGDALAERVKRLSQPPMMLSPLERSIHFLRGVYSRAGFVSAAFYTFAAAGSEGKGTPVVPGYPGIVFQHYQEHTAFASLTLDCRKAFDERPKGLTGGFFAKASDEVLEGHAAFWSKRDSASPEDALAALRFLRTLFRLLSKPRIELLKGSSELEQRVGLIKFHADRSAAHLSLDDYAIHISDMAHLAAALIFVGEIIRTFDAPWDKPGRFNDLDAGAAEAARTLFPDAFSLPMFEHMKIASHAEKCWQEPDWGLHYITRQLPLATGWA